MKDGEQRRVTEKETGRRDANVDCKEEIRNERGRTKKRHEERKGSRDTNLGCK